MIPEKQTLLMEASSQEIMAVDGSASLLKVYERTFATTKELKGLRLLNFTSGRVALDWLDRNPDRRPAVMLVDRNMEGFSGLDMLHRLKADERWRVIPVIMASSTGEHAHVVEAIKKGASDYLVKPLQSGVLAAKVLRVLAFKPAGQGHSRVTGAMAGA
jgi:two-component system, chemotaxis family, chemotaxis protein CheY